mgnify:CR=1 FL=1
MKLIELYNLKIDEYKKTGLRENPCKLLAMLLLSHKNIFVECGTLGEFYKQNKKYIDMYIKKVEKDFNFLQEDIEDIIEFTQQNVTCEEYQEQKIWNLYARGFEVLNWALTYRLDKTPESIYSEWFDDKSLSEDSKKFIEMYNLFYNEMPDFSLYDTQFKGQAMMSILSHYEISLDGYTYRPYTDAKVPYSVRLNLLKNDLKIYGKIEKIDNSIELNEHQKRIIKIIGDTIRSLADEKQVLEDVLFPLSRTLYMIDCSYLSLDAVDRITELTNKSENDVSDCIKLAKKIENQIDKKSELF